MKPTEEASSSDTVYSDPEPSMLLSKVKSTTMKKNPSAIEVNVILFFMTRLKKTKKQKKNYIHFGLSEFDSYLDFTVIF